MDETGKPSSVRGRLNPATEKLLSKITNLEENLEGIKAQDLTPEQQHLVKICETYLETARGYLDRPWWALRSRHPHMIWEMLHRVDEYFILLIKDAELYSEASYVKTTFDLNIKEDKVREEWIGANGKLKDALDHINKGEYEEKYRYVVKDALNLVNEQMDRTFWQLSMNTLTSVCSGILLGFLMFLALIYCIYCTRAIPPHANALYSLDSGGLCDHFLILIALGIMGAYLSNLMTTENFLYIQGAPFWRYFLHNLVSKPLMSGFAAVFIYILARSRLIFSITTPEQAKATVSQIISLNVPSEGVGYAYAMLAIVSGFAADKVLRNMIDSVLKKLEQKAEKSKDSEKKEDKTTDSGKK